MTPDRKEFPVTQYAAIFDSSRLLMLRDSGSTVPELKGKWVFPGGHVDEEKDLFEALKRELKEETGLLLEDAKPFHATIKKYVAGWTVIIYYRCKVRKDGIRLDHESDDYKWVSKNDIGEMTFRDSAEKGVVMQLLGGTGD